MIEIELNQSLLKGGSRFPSALLHRLAKTVSQSLNIKQQMFVSVAFVSPKKIRSLNKQYRAKDAVTDVLSFEMEPASGQMGELIICYNQAKKQAKEQKHSLKDEVAFLIVHGLLHLYGMDHEKEAQAKKMFTIQIKILDSLGIDSTI